MDTGQAGSIGHIPKKSIETRLIAIDVVTASLKFVGEWKDVSETLRSHEREKS